VAATLCCIKSAYHAIQRLVRIRLTAPPELISYFSQWYQFNPGDIVTTGSPAGVGFGRDPKVFMKPGDVVEVEVEGIGILSNKISAIN